MGKLTSAHQKWGTDLVHTLVKESEDIGTVVYGQCTWKRFSFSLGQHTIAFQTEVMPFRYAQLRI
jgi:hypothetical protein